MFWAPLISEGLYSHSPCLRLLSFLHSCGELGMREKRTCQSSKCASPVYCGWMLHISPQGETEFLAIVQWGAWDSHRGHGCQEGYRWQKLKLIGQKWAAFRKCCDQCSFIHLFLTSLVRVHFNEVSLKENLHGPKCWVLDLMELLACYGDFFLCRCVCERVTNTISRAAVGENKKQTFKVNLRGQCVDQESALHTPWTCLDWPWAWKQVDTWAVG